MPRVLDALLSSTVQAGSVTALLACPAGAAWAQQAEIAMPEVSIIDRREAGYGVSRSSTATKTDTPILQTPISIQAVPREVLDDKVAVRIEDAVRNISGVQPRGTWEWGAASSSAASRISRSTATGWRTATTAPASPETSTWPMSSGSRC